MRRLVAEFSRGLILGLAIFAASCVAAVWFMTSMPGQSYEGPPDTDAEARTLAEALQGHVVQLARVIGERNFDRYEELDRAAAYIADVFATLGCTPELQPYDVWEGSVANIECEFLGATNSDEIVVIGAHYDSVEGSPGANDNASGVAVLLELAKRVTATPLPRSLRFVAFVNEEPPYFQTNHMGSLVYAQRAAGEDGSIIAMVSLETLGFYSDEPGSQTYPPFMSLLYPKRGNFVALVANPASRALVRKAILSFRSSGASIPSEGLAAPGFIQGVAWSDQWAFWLHGIPAIMVTDTAPFRYAEYHTSRDTPEHLDYVRMANVVDGLVSVVRDLATEPAT